MSNVGDPCPLADYEFVRAARQGTPLDRTVHCRNQPFTPSTVVGSTLSIKVPASEAPSCLNARIAMQLELTVSAPDNDGDIKNTALAPYQLDQILGAYSMFDRIQVIFGTQSVRVDIERERLVGWMQQKRWFTAPFEWAVFQNGVKNQLAHPCSFLQGNDALLDTVSHARQFTSVVSSASGGVRTYTFTIDLLLPLPELPDLLPLDCWGDMNVHLDFKPLASSFTIVPVFHEAITVTGSPSRAAVPPAPGAIPETDPSSAMTQTVALGNGAAMASAGISLLSSDMVHWVAPSETTTLSAYAALTPTAYTTSIAPDNPLLASGYLVYNMHSLQLKDSDLLWLQMASDLGLYSTFPNQICKNFASQHGFNAAGQTVLLSMLVSCEPNCGAYLAPIGGRTLAGVPCVQTLSLGTDLAGMMFAQPNGQAYSLAPNLRRIWAATSPHTCYNAGYLNSNQTYSLVPLATLQRARGWWNLEPVETPSRVHDMTMISTFAANYEPLKASKPTAMLGHLGHPWRMYTPVGDAVDPTTLPVNFEGLISSAPPSWLCLLTNDDPHANLLYGNIGNIADGYGLREQLLPDCPLVVVPVWGGGYGVSNLTVMAADGLPSLVPMPGMQSVLQHVVIERAYPWLSQLDNPTIQVDSVILKEVYLKYESVPSDPETVAAIKRLMASDEGFVERQVTVEMYKNSLPVSQATDDSVNMTIPLTYSRVHGITLQALANTPEYPFGFKNQGLLMSKCTVLADNVQLLNLQAGQIPLPRMPFFTLEPKTATSFTSWVIPKVIPEQPVLWDNLRTLGTALHPDASYYAWEGIKTWPCQFIPIPLTNDGGHIPVANLNLQISVTLKASVESSLIYTGLATNNYYLSTGIDSSPIPAFPAVSVAQGVYSSPSYGYVANYEDAATFLPSGSNRVLVMYVLITTEYVWKKSPGSGETHLIIKK